MTWKYSDEYAAAAALLKSNSATPGSAEQKAMSDLALLMEAEGPNPARVNALNAFHQACAEDEAAHILKLAGTGLAKAKVAGALKGLRHLHLLSKFGGSDVWMISTPRSYRAWPIEEVGTLADGALTTRLKDTTEYHTSTEMRNAQSAAQKAIAWAQKACLASLANAGVAGDQGETLITRWFADEDHRTTAKMAGLRARLAAGFLKIASAAASGRMILGDNPKMRGTDSENDEAFVFVGGEKLNMVYIEGAFFNENNVLKGVKNWARILVHELSHLKLDTKDIKLPGDADARYAWHPRGIRPRKASFTTAHAIDNAENWAFFAADAAGELTEFERNVALKPQVE